MVKLFTSKSPEEVELVKSVLEKEGIACSMQNQNLSLGLGEIPHQECWAELWLHNESDLSAAQQVFRDLTAKPDQLRAWRCAKCGEEVPAEFGTCWNCSSARDDECEEVGPAQGRQAALEVDFVYAEDEYRRALFFHLCSGFPFRFLLFVAIGFFGLGCLYITGPASSDTDFGFGLVFVGSCGLAVLFALHTVIPHWLASRNAGVHNPHQVTIDDRGLDVQSPLRPLRATWPDIKKICVTDEFLFFHPEGCFFALPRRTVEEGDAFRKLADVIDRHVTDIDDRSSHDKRLKTVLGGEDGEGDI